MATRNRHHGDPEPRPPRPRPRNPPGRRARKRWDRRSAHAAGAVGDDRFDGDVLHEGDKVPATGTAARPRMGGPADRHRGRRLQRGLDAGLGARPHPGRFRPRIAAILVSDDHSRRHRARRPRVPAARAPASRSRSSASRATSATAATRSSATAGRSSTASTSSCSSTATGSTPRSCSPTSSRRSSAARPRSCSARGCSIGATPAAAGCRSTSSSATGSSPASRTPWPGLSLTEWHSGYRACRVAALATIPFEANSDGFDFDTEILLQLHANGMRIAEVPIPTYYGDEICYVTVSPTPATSRRTSCATASPASASARRARDRGAGVRVEARPGLKPRPAAELVGARPPGRVLDLGCGRPARRRAAERATRSWASTCTTRRRRRSASTSSSSPTSSTASPPASTSTGRST